MSQSDFPQLSASDKKLVQRIVQRLYRRYTPERPDDRVQSREELFHYGIIGLLEARRNFSDKLGAGWSTFAAYRIEGAIIDNLRKAPLIRLPQEAQSRVRALKEAQIELGKEQEIVSTQDLAAKLNWTPAEVEKTRTLKPKLLTAVDDHTHTEEINSPNEAVLAEESPESDPQTNLIRKEIAALLEHCLNQLPETGDRIIVKARKLEDITLKELAASFNCSIESIRKREQNALIQLKECMRRNDIEEVY